MPAGWYPVAVDETEMKPTANGDGAYLNARLTVLDGPHKGSKVWHRFNIKNASEKAVEIGYKQLSALMHAVGVIKMEATEQLHNKPLFVKLKFVPAEGQYDSKNEITAFRKSNDEAAIAGYKAMAAGAGALVTKAITPPPAQAPAAAPGGWTPPAAQQPWNGAGNSGGPAPAATATAPATSTPGQASATPASAAAPSWNQQAPATSAPAAQAPALAPSQEQTAAPATGETMPPWMTSGNPAQQ